MVLKIGDKGDKVKELQELLGITVDGDFGPKTEKAVKEFQKDNGLSVVKAFTDERDKPSIFLSTTYGTIWIEESIII